MSYDISDLHIVIHINTQFAKVHIKKQIFTIDDEGR